MTEEQQFQDGRPELKQSEFERILANAYDLNTQRSIEKAADDGKKSGLEKVKKDLGEMGTTSKLTLDMLIDRARKAGIDDETIKEAIKKNFSKNDKYEIFRGVSKSILNFTKKIALGVTMPIFTLPSSLRLLAKNTHYFMNEGYYGDDREDGFDKEDWGISATINIIYTAIASAIIYNQIANQNPRLALYMGATQVATNITSGIYEAYKHNKKRIEMRKGNELEQIIDNAFENAGDRK
jgi:hypothetical protein